MTRRISPFFGAIYVLTPHATPRNGASSSRVEPDDWRPYPTDRRPGWSARRRGRYPFKDSAD
ncbi:hypothetical protein [uncultured Roseovarius sp.]|uniref:hypothetical protein n=1 Tax=uncultured Roseovarius sp. TaxID=293344 RepID=UPI00262B46B0|nr:hypothetical protein [uncultured Roseovarius sp.]